MIFSSQNIMKSLSKLLQERYPAYPVYTILNRQEMTYPCFILSLISSTLENQIGNRLFCNLCMEIVFVQQHGSASGEEEITDIIDCLDEVLELIPYSDGESTALIRSYERQWRIENEELHYQFHIKNRMSLVEKENLMKELEGNNASIKQ
ncbi:DUF6838 family protein [Lachnospiraceae bacterium 62-35]